MRLAAAPIYAAYAPIYDAIGQGQFSVRMAVWALAWLAERGIEQPARVLDLACGTGAAALVFAAAGCEVTGVDQSALMLDIARGKMRDAGYDLAFICGDMRELPTEDERRTTKDQRMQIDSFSSFVLRPSSFDLVTCFYDSMNYLLDDGDLGRVCAAVARVLSLAGTMIFDLNTAAEYATWDERDSVTHDGHDCMVYNQLSYDPDTCLATGRIVWFVREIDRWWRGEETHVERAWSDGEVRAALTGAGLALIGRYDATGDLAAADAPRVVYVARRASEDEMINAMERGTQS
ncbi:MAG: class I SAM-dependent methyltransferase [Roseiflexaceae bacterium]